VNTTTTATANKTEEFQIKRLKTAGGEETLRFEVSLYFRDKRVASVSNGGTGGCHEWHWIDKASEQSFEQHLKTLTFEFDFEQGDQFLNALIDKQVEDTWLKSKCRKATLFLLVGKDEKKGYETIQAVFNADVKAHLVKKYGSQLKEIVNERFL